MVLVMNKNEYTGPSTSAKLTVEFKSAPFADIPMAKINNVAVGANFLYLSTFSFLGFLINHI